MRRLLGLIWSYLKVGIANELQYRVNFFIQVLQSLISLGVGLVSLALVFQYTDELGGWSHSELMIVMGIYILMGGVISTFIQPNMDHLLSDIQNGTLDFALTKPVDSQAIVSLRDMHFWSLMDVLVGLGVVGVGAAQMGQRVGAGQALEFALAILLGGILIYCFWLTVTSIAFWVIRLGDFFLVFQAIYAAGRWPVGIYPDWLRVGLTFLVPVAFAITVPAEALAGRLTAFTMPGALAVTLGFTALTRLVWRLAIRHYSGASA
jgi:ABC-2 type transport system permease protein